MKHGIESRYGTLPFRHLVPKNSATRHVKRLANQMLDSICSLWDLSSPPKHLLGFSAYRDEWLSHMPIR